VDARLWLARALAWALLFGGWTVLGALGHEAARGGAVPGLPLAAWLASIGALLALGARRALSGPVLAIGIAASAAATGLALSAAHGGQVVPLLAAALGWAMLVVLASRVVRALRLLCTRRAPAPIGPALAGAALAWAAVGDPVRAVADPTSLAFPIPMALAAAAAALVALGPRRGMPVGGCRSGLFDCSLPLPRGDGWRRPADWPLHAAALAMLPTMAALPAMTELCAADGLSPSDVAAMHLAAMVLPAWLLRGPLGAWRRGTLSAVVAALLVAGGAALAFGTRRDALLAGMLMHATAWSLAWAGPMLARDAPATKPESVRAQLVAAAGAAAAVALLAAAATRGGPDVLRGAHVALAALAAAGFIAARALPRRDDLRGAPTR
jgi:hypothetical protein